MISPYQEQKSEQRIREEDTYINQENTSIYTTENGGFSPDQKQSDANHDPFLETITTKNEGIMDAGMIVRTNSSPTNNEGILTFYYPYSSTQQDDGPVTHLNNQSSLSMIQPTQGPTPASTPTQKLSPRLRSISEQNASQSRTFGVDKLRLERHQRQTTSFSPYHVPFLRYNQRKQQQQSISEEERQKRRLERNRIAAKQCRERKKVYVANLESKVTRLEEENERLCRELAELNTKLQQQTLVIQEGVRLHMLTEELEARLHLQHQSSRRLQKQSVDSLPSEDTV
ncbi:10182_t:CDS:2 [Funneliformis caledonium]|uniref:10182_t:CDS:1 n=1 Tax=Funneliformis caledonium TaxID=1117310 RepID=A0A9N9FQR4_9GLOM|nr:10182_t:CDS:2 [Funneliformis caledonium]